MSSKIALLIYGLLRWDGVKNLGPIFFYFSRTKHFWVFLFPLLSSYGSDIMVTISMENAVWRTTIVDSLICLQLLLSIEKTE